MGLAFEDKPACKQINFSEMESHFICSNVPIHKISEAYFLKKR